MLSMSGAFAMIPRMTPTEPQTAMTQMAMTVKKIARTAIAPTRFSAAWEDESSMSFLYSILCLLKFMAQL
jgi:hypothetical protein